MANLDLTGYNIGSLETTYVLTRQQPDGEQKVVEADADAGRIEGLRQEYEQTDAHRAEAGPELNRYRVYEVRLDVRERSRTVLPGDVRFEVVERTATFVGEERLEWTVARIGGAKPTFSTPILDEGHAQLMCDFQNKLPDGYDAYYRPQLRSLVGKPIGPGVEVSYRADYTPDKQGDWSSSRSIEQLDVALGEVERHHSTEDQRRAAYAAEQEEKAREEANRRVNVQPLDEGERAWFFRPGAAPVEIQDNGETLWVTKSGRYVVETWDSSFVTTGYVEASLDDAAVWLVRHEIDPAKYEGIPQELIGAYAGREH